MLRRRVSLFALLLVSFCASALAQAPYYPDAVWQRKTPAEAGVNAQRLKDAIDYAVAAGRWPVRSARTRHAGSIRRCWPPTDARRPPRGRTKSTSNPWARRASEAPYRRGHQTAPSACAAARRIPRRPHPAATRRIFPLRIPALGSKVAAGNAVVFRPATGIRRENRKRLASAAPCAFPRSASCKVSISTATRSRRSAARWSMPRTSSSTATTSSAIDAASPTASP